MAGEASGDLLAGLLLRGLRRRWSSVQAGGIGGPRMQAEGFEAWAASERLSVFGYVDAIKRLPELLWLRRKTRRRILHERPAVFVGVDAPDFNFGLEAALRRQGLRTVHFVCPSIWAWRPQRVVRLREAADHVLCLFPFEPALLATHGVPATYVGHPVADLIPMAVDRVASRGRLGTGLAPGQGPLVALLPGSRQAEIRLIAPILQASALEMLRHRPDLSFVLPAAPGLEPMVRAAMTELCATGRLRILQGQSHEVLAAADVALVASGTATLEAALWKCPMVIVYRLAEADWARMRKLQLQPWVGLPNILSREFIVPERIQEAAQAHVIADDALRWLDDEPARQAYSLRCAALHAQLRQDTGLRAADALEALIHG